MATVAFDPLSVSFTADPHPVLKALRESDPVHRFEPFGCWLLTRYDDVHDLFSDNRTQRPRLTGLFNQDATPDPSATPPMSAARRAHRGHERNVIFSTCSAQVVARSTTLIADLIRDRLRPLRNGHDIVDVAPVLGGIPNLVVTHFFGVPPPDEDEDTFFEITRLAFRLFNMFLTKEERAESEQAHQQLTSLVANLIAERLARPGDDRFTELFGAHVRSGRLNDHELRAWVVGLITAGSEATAQSALLMLRAVLSHPDQAELLRRDPSLVPNAVLECLRWDLVGKFGPRTAIEDFTLRGRRIRAGDTLLLSPTAAHRDPAVFANPDCLDVRRDTSREMVFGRGHYSCLGAYLAKVELVILLRELLEIFPAGSRVLEDQLVWNPSRLNIRLLESLPIRRSHA